MELQVEFTTSSYSKHAIYLASRNFGLDFVDYARAVTVPKLDLDKIYNYFSGLYYNPTIELTEKIARESKLFKEKSKVTVVVEQGTLNQFVKLTCEIIKDEITGEITSVIPKYKINEEELIEWWRKNKFATEIKEKK